jgi:hypothetical protein
MSDNVNSKSGKRCMGGFLGSGVKIWAGDTQQSSRQAWSSQPAGKPPSIDTTDFTGGSASFSSVVTGYAGAQEAATELATREEFEVTGGNGVPFTVVWAAPGPQDYAGHDPDALGQKPRYAFEET